MSELLSTGGDFFDRYVIEKLGGEEYEKPNIAALSLAGLTGSGISSTARELAQIARDRTGRPVHLFSSSEFALIRAQQRQGQKNAQVMRDPASVYETDTFILDQLINPQHTNSIVITEGRLTPFLMIGARQAAAKRGITLPFEGLGIYLFATEPVRYSRKYLEAVRSDPTLNFDDFRERLRNQAVEEQQGFVAAYPRLLGQNPNSMAFQYQGEPVYKLRFDTTTQRPFDTASSIFESEKVQNLLNRTAHP